jgi:RND family efflux transporter MFP subunit
MAAADDLSKLKIDKSQFSTRPRRKRKLLILCAVALAIVLAGFFSGIFTPAQSVRIATISQIYPSQTFTLLNASGYVVAQRKSALASKVTGRLAWLGVEEGNHVKNGDIVARLENDDLKAASDQARGNLGTAVHSLEQAKAELNDATIEMKRAKELISKGYIAQTDYDTAFARFQKADAGVKAAEATVRAAKAALNAAEVALGYTFIRAPFDAVVLTKNADVGDIVTSLGAAANVQAAVVTVADMSSLLVEADVSESNLELVSVGQPCEIQLDALPENRFPGKVHMIVPTADRTKATVMVKIAFINRDPRILPEMSAKVAFLSRQPVATELTPRTAVNQSAFVTRKGKTFIFVKEGDQVVQKEVVVGAHLGDMIEIRQGAKAGQQVVLNPTPGLRNGSRIKVAES